MARTAHPTVVIEAPGPGDDVQAIEAGLIELAAQLPETGGPVTGVGNVNVREWGGTFGAHIVDVHVDPETGKGTVLRYAAVQDVGRAIHWGWLRCPAPGLLHGQTPANLL